MTDDPYARYLDDFGRDLERVATRPQPRRRRRVGLAAVAATTVAAVITVVAFVAPAGKRRLDVVDQARAALAPRGVIIHTVVRQTVELPRDHPADEKPPYGAAQTIEQWSATAPARWRMAFSYPRPGRWGGIGDAHGPIFGPVQFAYGEGASFTYLQRRNTLRIVAGIHDPRAAAVPGPLPDGNGDVVGAIRTLLADGTLTDRGAATVGVRRVRRLTGVVRRPHGAVDTWVEFDVDAHTFAPVVARVQHRVPRHGLGRSSAPIVVLRFLRYERLPLTPRTARLLDIQPVGRPAVTRLTEEEARASGLREEARLNREGRRNARRMARSRRAVKKAR